MNLLTRQHYLKANRAGRGIRDGRRFAVALCALLAGLCAPGPAPGAPGYLVNGPTSLRFADDPAKAKAFAWPPLIPESKPAATTSTNSVEQTPAATAPGGGAAPGPVLIAVTNLATAASTPRAVLGPQPWPAGAMGPGESGMTASEMLTITPQMLADYLKQAPKSSTRGATNTFLLPNLPFMPPAQPRLPASESIYQTQ